MTNNNERYQYKDYKNLEKIFESLDAEKELAYFIFNYIFTILGIPVKDRTYLRRSYTVVDKNINFAQIDTDLIFSEGKNEFFRFTCERELDSDEIALVRMIMDEFYKTSEYKFQKKVKQNNYTSSISLEANYKLAVQQGICNWIVGDRENRIHALMQSLEEWSVKTYEGRKVTFGFIVEKEETNGEGDPSCDVIEFLKYDYSATFTDCIDTVMEIDKKAHLIAFRSIMDGNKISKVELHSNVPYRFSHILEKYSNTHRTGIFLLNNGDIVLSRNKSLQLVKRNLRWLNISFTGFKTAYHASNKSLPVINDDLLLEVFASTLDVSFSHTGGIIAIMADPDYLNNMNQPEKTLSDVDYLLYDDNNRDDYKKITDELKDEPTSERDKRLIKRKFIKKLISGNKFPEIDRKLRTELISMDGACIIDSNGNICAVGAIIKNKSGSSEGGRGAACKKLSEYGLAVKISTDGYIEMFVKGNIVLSIK